jgi:hypothetical protein
MTFSLYAATVPTFQQILGAAAGVLAKAEAYCVDEGLAPAEILGARLAPDMLPYAYQIRAMKKHSAGAIDAVRTGEFHPDRSPPPESFAELADLLATARAELDAIDPAEVDGMIGRPTAFVFGELRMEYVAENFLLSFSQPNFFFHATTAYDLLRNKGLQIGKRDFMGAVRINR